MDRRAESSSEHTAAVQGWRARRWLWVAAGYAVLVGYLTVRDFGATAYDDSYFFKRFAINALEQGVFAWNVEDGPIFGSTSQLFQLLTTAVTAVTRTHFVVAVRLMNALALCGLGAWLFRWSARASSTPWGGPAVALLALGSPIVVGTVLTGMETAVALLLLAVVLIRLFPARGETLPAIAAWQAAALTVAVYLCRPDAAVLPAVAIVVVRLQQREFPVAYLAWLTALMLVVWGTAWAYYGTPLPLSFYMKSLALQNYGEHMVGLGRYDKQLHFGVTLALSAPLLWISIRSGARGVTLALLVASGCLWAYHLVSTNEIMGYRGRFYLPAVVPLAMAAARSWDGFLARPPRWPTLLMLATWAVAVAWAYAERAIPSHEGFFIARLSWPAYAGMVGAATGLMLASRSGGGWLGPVLVFVGLMAGLVGWKPPGPTRVPSDLAVMRKHSREVTTARGVFAVARCLPGKRSVYHSEMGVTGVVLMDRRVVDLAGILSRGPGIDGRPFQDYCEQDQPEAIFLPHRNYRVLNAEIRAAPCFANYRRVVDRSSSPLHVRADLYDAFVDCAPNLSRWRRRASR